jgi:hypothetical protein
MGVNMDVNKIIMESIQDVIGVIPDKKNEETKTEEAKIEDKKEIVAENIGGEAENNSYFSAATAAAISAGLGALALRKKLASLNETK